ncbi:MAG: UvrD-helicase domain-containing protein [Chloroflexi bacterium]|nr:UvrD-helicase domain-containing protein [Chloroflexota bacterium]
MTDLWTDLNPEQVLAVQAADGPVLVVAGPGSGKTRVLTHRIAYLLRERGVRPYNIVAVTFTNKAAREMKGRVSQLCGEDAERLTIGTFHAFCVRVLRQEAAHVGLGRNFTILDGDDQRRLVTQVLKDLNVDPKQHQPTAVHAAISRAKNDLITAATYPRSTWWHEVVARVFEQYDARKAEANALDFDDLLLKTAELLREHDDVREQYQRRHTQILVDEFQDTNAAQYELVGALAAAHQHLYVVGDEDQSIYSWRGADFRNVLRFQKDYPDAQVFLLQQNYRSTQTILAAAQAVIARNRQRYAKKLWTENERGTPVHLFEAYQEREEAEFVVGEILRLRASGQTNYGECAVMFRTNAQSRALEESFMRHGVPYTVIGAIRFYERKEIKDVLGYLRLIYNPADTISLMRVLNAPARGIGGKTIAQLGDWAASVGLSLGDALLQLAELQHIEGDLAGTPFSARSGKALAGFGELLSDLRALSQRVTLSELLQATLDQSGYLRSLDDHTEDGEDRINNVRELLSVTSEYNAVAPDMALLSFLESAALVSDVDEVGRVADAVTLQTLHTAKGLEFETVFMVGMEEGLCPHSRSMEDPDGMEEERRLCYVGMTRAKRNLYLLRTFRRTLYGNSEAREASRFLRDIPPELCDGARPRRATLPPRVRPSELRRGW